MLQWEVLGLSGVNDLERKSHMKKWMIAVAVIVILIILGGRFMYRHFVTDLTLDVPGMTNPAAPMLELLNAEWMSEDGVWSVHIGGKEGNTFDLSYRQELVYSGNFSFGFQGEDLNVKMELDFYDKQFEREDGSVTSTIESLYVENCRMYLDIIVSKEGEDSMRQQVVLDRAEYGKLAESESREMREASEMAELVEFSWNQITIGDSGFRFHIVCAGQDPIDPRLSCRYMDREAHKIVQIGDEGSIKECPTIPAAQWAKLADFLRKAELSAYREPDLRLTGDMEVHTVTFVSKIQVTWWDGGEEFTNSYDGTSADELLELLKDIAKEANSQKSGQNQPAPEGSWTCSCGQTGNTGRFCTECGQPKLAESESEEMREVSELAELVEFSWHQSAMSYDSCFDFQITSSEQESAAPRLYCSYTDPETGERIEIGEESSGFQGFRLDGTRTDSAACPPVPLERWEELAVFLHTAELSPYHPPEPGLMDATDSKIQVTWQEDGEKFSNSYSGIYAHELLKLLQDIAGEVYRKAEK